MKKLMLRLSLFVVTVVLGSTALAAKVYVCGSDQDLVVAVDQGVLIYAQTNHEIFSEGVEPQFFTAEGAAGYTFFVDEYDGSNFYYQLLVKHDSIIRTQILIQDIGLESFQPLPIPGSSFTCRLQY